MGMYLTRLSSGAAKLLVVTQVLADITDPNQNPASSDSLRHG